MPKRNPRNPKPAPLLDELRSIEACAPEEPVAKSASLCLLRVVSGLDAPTWSSLSLDHGLGHWCAVPLGCPTPKAEVLAQAIGQLAAGPGAPELHTLLRVEIERSRNCAVPLALALIEPDAELPLPQDHPGLLELIQSLKRSFDHAARHDGTRVALVFSGASLAEAERLVGGILRRLRSKTVVPSTGTGSGLLCSAGLAGYGGCLEFSPEDLLRRAAQALNNARTLGGNRLEIAPPVDADMAPRDTLVHASEKHFLFTGKKAGDL